MTLFEYDAVRHKCLAREMSPLNGLVEVIGVEFYPTRLRSKTSQWNPAGVSSAARDQFMALATLPGVLSLLRTLLTINNVTDECLASFCG